MACPWKLDWKTAANAALFAQQGETYDNVSYSVVSSMNDYHAAKMIRLPDSVPASAGGLNKTSKNNQMMPVFCPIFACTVR